MISNKDLLLEVNIFLRALQVEYSFSGEFLRKSPEFGNELGEDMSISLSKYLERFPNLSKDSLLEAVKLSKCLTYDQEKEILKFQLIPRNFGIIIEDSASFKSKEDLISFIESKEITLSSIVWSEHLIKIEFDNETAAQKISQSLTGKTISHKLVHQNLKEFILQSKIVDNEKNSRPRKISENVSNEQNFHKSSIYSNNNSKKDNTQDEGKGGYKGKPSFNKFDGNIPKSGRKKSNAQAKPFKSFPQSSYYSFKDISDIFQTMKNSQGLAYPAEWNNDFCSDFATKEPRNLIDKLKEVKGGQSQRNRAYTEVMEANHFGKGRKNDEYWSHKRDSYYKY